jgi:hypothetical protein
MRVSGITGVGKSFELKRLLGLLPQVIDRHSADGGRLRQVVWLYVPVSFDGSLGGFLLGILRALDDAAGTTYCEDRALTRLSVEVLAVRVSILLRGHAVGVLVIDELQRRTFSRRSHANLLPLFFLRLLNVGVPLVLVGNPGGLNELSAYAQDVRRLSSGGTHRYDVYEVDDEDWVRLASVILAVNVLPKPSAVTPTELWQHCGGIREYAVRLWAEAQCIALKVSASTVSPVHLEAAWLGSRLSDDDRDLILGFRDKDPSRLVGFDDISMEEYVERWGFASDHNAHAPQSEQPKGPPKFSSMPLPLAIEKAAKARRTRKVNEDAKQRELQRALSPEDLRRKQASEAMVSDIEALSRAEAPKPHGEGVSL